MSSVPIPAGASASVAVVSSRATPDFPDTIKFELTAEVQRDVALVDLVYLQASLETFQLLPAEHEINGHLVTARASADLATYFLPVGIDLTYHWVITMTNGEVVETSESVVTWIDDRFEWDLTSLPEIEIYSYDRSEEFLDFTSDICAEAGSELVALYGLPAIEPIRIWVYKSGEDFAGTLATNSQDWAAGTAYPDLQVIQAVIPEDSQSEVTRVLPHEISHQLLYQATVNPYTVTATWIDEGLAVIAQTGGKERYRDVVADGYMDAELLPLRGLISSFPFEPDDARKAYAQSFLVMEYVLATYGPEVIPAIIEGYSLGLSHDDVLIRALGLDTDQLEAAWLQSLASAAMELAA
jgi:hypothetical protein